MLASLTLPLVPTMASSCGRCAQLGFPSEWNRYSDAASRKNHGLLHLEVDLGVDGGTAQELLDKMEQDCFSLEKQQETLQTLEKYVCPKCEFSARTKKQLIRHFRGVHLQKRCEVCGRQFSKYYRLAIHLISSHTGRRPHKCDQCSKGFKRKDYLKRHQNDQHSSEREKKKNAIKIQKNVMKSKVALGTKKEMSCATCEKSFQVRRALLQHEKWLHERPADCELCGLRFHTQKALNHHRTDKHLDGRKTQQPYELVVVHDRGKEAWRCLRCGLLLSSAALADAHQLKHSTDPDQFDAGTKKEQKVLKFHCFKCDFLAPTESRLISHLRLVHLKGTQSKCGLCEKMFKSPTYLADHLLSHSSYHPFKCVCGLTFKRNNNFMKHLLFCVERTEQTMLVKEKCSLWKDSAVTRSVLRHHIRVVHLKNREKTCRLCGKTCLNPSLLANHLLLSHPSYKSNFKNPNEYQLSAKPALNQPRNSDKRATVDAKISIPQKKFHSTKSDLSFIGAMEGEEPGWRCKFCEMHYTSRSGFFYSHLRSHQIHPEPALQSLQHSEMASHREEAGRGSCSLVVRTAGDEDLLTGHSLSEGVVESSEQEEMSRPQLSPSSSLPSVGEPREAPAETVSKVLMDLMSIPGLGIQACWQRAKELLKNPIEQEGSELAVSDPLARKVFRVQSGGAFLLCEESCPDFRLKYQHLFCCHTLAAARATKRLHLLLRTVWEEIQRRSAQGNDQF